MRKKSVLCLLSAVIMLLLLFAGCTSETSPESTAGTAAGTQPTTLQDNDPELTPVDLGGYEFTIADEFTTMWEQEPGNSPHGDAVMDRVHKVEQDYNCTIKYVPVGPLDLAAQVRTKAMAGEKSYDLIGVNLWGMGGLLPEKFLEPINKFENIHMDASYWAKEVTAVGTFGGSTYFLSPTFMMAGYSSSVMFFNKDMLEELSLDNPWDYVEKGEWTWDKFAEIAAAAVQDLNGDNKIDTEDRAGAAVLPEFAYSAYIASVGKVIEEDGDSAKIIMNNERSLSVYDKLSNIMNVQGFMSFKKENTLQNQQSIRRQFSDDRQALFLVESAGFGKAFGRDADFDFGMLPLPSLEAGDKNYCPLDHNFRVLALPIKNSDIEKATVVFNALAANGKNEVEAQIAEYIDNGWIGDERSEQFFKEMDKYILVDRAGVFFHPSYPQFMDGTRNVVGGVMEGAKFISRYDAAADAAEAQLREIWAKIVA